MKTLTSCMMILALVPVRVCDTASVLPGIAGVRLQRTTDRVVPGVPNERKRVSRPSGAGIVRPSPSTGSVRPELVEAGERERSEVRPASARRGFGEVSPEPAGRYRAGVGGQGGALRKGESTGVIESAYSERDIPLDPDPNSQDWTKAPRVTVHRDKSGEPIPGSATEIRSRWTKEHLFLLYICPYDELNLKPNPDPSTETPKLWTWDVAEAFIGSDFERIGRYKEFQVSPQSEWVDLAIDRDNPKGQEGMKWNSGYAVKARIDAQAKVWYGMMRIPFAAIDARSPEVGRELRIGLYRIAGVNPRKYYAWRPTGQDSFHVPQAFGILRLR